jgi:hypothetical protein
MPNFGEAKSEMGQNRDGPNSSKAEFTGAMIIANP